MIDSPARFTVALLGAILAIGLVLLSLAGCTPAPAPGADGGHEAPLLAEYDVSRFAVGNPPPVPTGFVACYRPLLGTLHFTWDADGYRHVVELQDDLGDAGVSDWRAWGPVGETYSDAAITYDGKAQGQWWVHLRALDSMDVLSEPTADQHVSVHAVPDRCPF